MTEAAPLILIVDDHPDNRTYIATILGYAGYRTIEAPDGETALEHLRTSAPAVAIVDIPAEGIETERELQALRALGVRYGQGWHLGRPGPLPG